MKFAVAGQGKLAAGLYSIVCVVAIFVLNSRASLADSLSSQDPSTFTQATLDQANASDSHVKTVLVFAAVLFILWIILQRRVKAVPAPVGAYQAVYKRAGGVIVRIVSLVSPVLVILSQNTSNGTGSKTLSDIANQDHMGMLYLGVRVVLGAMIAFYAYRLMRITADGIDRINAAR